MTDPRVLRLLKDTTLQNGVKFPAGQEIEVVMDVVYVGGYPLPPNTIFNLFKKWVFF